MIRHPTTLTKIRLHCRSVATAAKPRAPDTVSYLDKWAPRPERPLRTPTPKVWARPQQPIPSSPTSTETRTPAGNPSTTRTAPPPESLKKWAQPVAPPSDSKPPGLSIFNSESHPSIVPPTSRAAPSPEALKKWSRPVALPSNSLPSQLSVPNSNSQPSIAPLADQKVSHPSQPTSLSSDSDPANSSPTVEYPHRVIGAGPPLETLKKWSRPVAPPYDSVPSQTSIQPSIAPLADQKVSHPSQPTSLSPHSEPANSSPTLVEYPHRVIGTGPPPETLKKWSRPVAPPSDSVPSQIAIQPSIAPLADQKISHPSQPTSLSPHSDPANSSLTLVEYPHRVIGTGSSPETLKKWSRPVAPPSDSVPSQIVIQPSIALLDQKGFHPSQHTLHSDPANSSPTLVEHPHRVIGAGPPPETLKKWSRPVAPPSDSAPSQISIQPSIATLADQKVSHPSEPTSLSLHSDPANSSPTLVEYPHRVIGTGPPHETLKKWSRPVAPSDSLPSQISIASSNFQPSIAPLADRNVFHPSEPTSLSPHSDPANSSPTLVEYPHRVIGAGPLPETLKKWSRPVVLPSDSVPQTSVPNSNSQPSVAPLAAQKVLQPINNSSQPTSLSPDSDHANSSPRSVETPAESPHRSIHAAPPSETLNKSRPVAPHSSSILPRKPVLKSNSQSSTAPLAARKVSQPKSNAPHPTSFSPDSKHANQSPEKEVRPQTPPRQEFSPSLDTDPVDEFDDKRLRPDAYRRNQKSYFEGRGRFERVSSKVLLQQSANTPLSKKKTTSPVPKLIKARRMDVFIPSTLSVAALATLLNVKLARLQQQMKRAGMESESSYDHILTSDYAVLLAEEFGRNPIVDDEAAFDIHPPVAHPNLSSLTSRPPIVTIMGHVDHGKTTLLDTLRSASVAKGEAGGITQHIGAFSVPVNETGSGPKSITFLDTPGHAAFSAMRARGVNVTDIIVLVVAADDGIMPQTKEVINLFKRDDSQVSLVVAINKIDKPNVDLDSVKRALMAEGIQVEDFGGDIPAVHVSGLTGEGLPELLETLTLVAEMQDLRAEHTGSVYGHVLESNVQKGLGPVATVLIRRGCLKAGTNVLSGLSHAKVRRMNDSNGKVVKEAIPGMAVTVSGWKILPKAGDIVLDGSENDIKKAISNRARRQELEALHQDVDAINSRRQEHRDLRSSGEDEAPIAPVSSGPLELKLIIKADVSGSAEAVRDALHGIGNAIARAQVISTGVGAISESDVMMAKAANATIVGFSVTASRSVQNNATQNGVPVCTSDIIYRLVDDVRERVTALLPVIVETKVTGEATILQLFDIDLKQRQTMKIAGCRVTNGVIEKQKFTRVLRNGDIIFDGTLSTMRHIKKDITEARKGTECGLGFGEFRDLEAGDLIQMYEKIEKPGVI